MSIRALLLKYFRSYSMFMLMGHHADQMQTLEGEMVLH